MVCDWYTSLDELPLWNWFKIIETDNLAYLYKSESDYNLPAPAEFALFYVDMVYQFDKLDLTLARMQANLAYMKSRAATNKDARVKSEVNSIETEIQRYKHRLETQPKPKLNDFINYIEITFKNVGQLDPKKISTSRAYSLYEQAKTINERNTTEHVTD